MKLNLTADFIDNEPIMDSVYGVIKISQFEKSIISTKEMQRLRGIKQLGFVNFVYPDAEHSRFAHSIGVCHQAKTMINHVENNLKNSKRYQDWRNKHCKVLSDKTFGITNIEKIIISVAALLHDLPHSPFSHEIETPDNNENGIPVHDDFKNNPAFFSYLFDTSKSDLAKIIDLYNESFWELVKKDEKWGKEFNNNKEIDENGYVKILDDGSILSGSLEKCAYEKLPLIGVMIFELLLFDKVDKWLVIKESGENTPNRNGIDIVIDHSKNKLNWKPIENWFRPYRKDIVANTICADLLDYLIRDGRNTGLFPSLDLKFFDRMTIAKAIPDKTNTLIPLSEIPDFCEHIVFDIYDHKRGIIRQSIITEIVAFLQQRYLLAERVYNHRVVEGARSMLQEASYLLVSSRAIDATKLHDTNNQKGAPISDDSFLTWVLNIDAKNNVEIPKAQRLVKMIQERRIFRELVIIDGILGSHKGTFRGNDVNCKTLADALLNQKKKEIIINALNEEVDRYFNKKENKGIEHPSSKNEKLFTIGVRKFGKRYKIPRVLVARPITNTQENDIETFPLFEGKKLPSINDRLESMQLAYNSLWKVFLFIHPFFHYQKYIDLHQNLAKTFKAKLYEATNINWENSIEKYGDLLPESPIDIPTFISINTIPEIDVKLINKIRNAFNKTDYAIREKIKLDIKYNKALKDALSQSEYIIRRLASENIKEKVINNLDNFIPVNVGEAARDGIEEIVIKDLVSYIEKLISDEQEVLF